jgi:hypothetical protein
MSVDGVSVLVITSIGSCLSAENATQGVAVKLPGQQQVTA